MVHRTGFTHTRVWRQSTSSRLIVKSLNRYDSGTFIHVPSMRRATTTVALYEQESTGGASEYTTQQRSAYSVLRSRNGPPNTCAQHIIAAVPGTRAANLSRCCCTALLYRSVPERLPLSPQYERERDDFVLALKLSGAEQALRDLIGSARYARLVGTALVQACQVGLCQDLPQLADATPSDAVGGEDVDGGGAVWVARLLMTLEEDNRVRWLREDATHAASSVSRAPSFRAMYAAYYTAAPETEALPTVRHLEAVEERMRENRVEWEMCDAAVVAAFARQEETLQPFLCHIIQHVLLQEPMKGGTEASHTVGAAAAAAAAAAASSLPPRKAQLQHIFAATLILQTAQELLEAAQQAGGRHGEPPTFLLATATKLFRLVAVLSDPTNNHTAPEDTRPNTNTNASNTVNTEEMTLSVLIEVSHRCSTVLLALSALCIVPPENPRLAEFTLWLLCEAPGSASCQHHFHRMVRRSHPEALLLLERSGLLSTKSIDLATVTDKLLPLLESSGSEDFVFLVVREILVGLEERLRQDAASFTPGDMRRLATLGTRLFEAHPLDEASHNHACDAATQAQLDELQVMDGSPWALVTFSYTSLKEILRALVRDHQSLNRHLREQVRNIVEAVTAIPPALTNCEEAKSKSTSTSTASEDKSGAPKAASSSVRTASPTAKGGSFSLNSDSCGEQRTADGTIPVSASNVESSKPHGTGRKRPMRLSTPPALRERFVRFVEELVKALVDENGTSGGVGMVVSEELLAFVVQHVPVPNIHDEYRRKLFLLVNVTDGKVNTGEDAIPPDLRLLVASLPLTLSPWASVMILREVLSESSGNNPRYSYVLNAAIDLQLPISTTRSRIATTLNMWRFLSAQSHKLTLMEQVSLKRRCALNLPLAYILSSYWSLLTWLFLCAIIGLNVVGLDFESQYVATRLFHEFAAPEDIVPEVTDPWCVEDSAKLVTTYLAGSPHEAATKRHRRISSEAILTSASYLFLGAADQQYPMTIIPVRAEGSAEEEYHSAAAALREFSRRLSFPFYVPLEQQLPVELIIARVAERIRRVSFNNAWFVSRVIFRTFPLGRHHTEYGLVAHTCAQANLTRRRVTFLLHFHSTATLPPQLLARLRDSVLAQSANLILIAPEGCLIDETVSQSLPGLRWLPCGRGEAATATATVRGNSMGASARPTFGPRPPTELEKIWYQTTQWCDAASRYSMRVGSVAVDKSVYILKNGLIGAVRWPIAAVHELRLDGVYKGWVEKIS